MERDFDVILFGATGTTGKRTARCLAQAAEREGLRWAVAGRSEARLKELGLACPVIVADSGNPASLAEMAASSVAVLNVVGPYRFHGRPVVAACVEAGTHYFDICGEPEFLERTAAEFDGPAKERGIVVLPSCGFDSVPSDYGVVHAMKLCQVGVGAQIVWAGTVMIGIQ